MGRKSSINILTKFYGQWLLDEQKNQPGINQWLCNAAYGRFDVAV